MGVIEVRYVNPQSPICTSFKLARDFSFSSLVIHNLDELAVILVLSITEDLAYNI